MKITTIKDVWIMIIKQDFSDRFFVKNVTDNLTEKLKKLTAPIQADGDGFHI